MTKEKAEHYIACAVAQLIICLPLWFVSQHRAWMFLMGLLIGSSIAGLLSAIQWLIHLKE
ncbi:hypothetical protein B8A39_06560 [Dolosigranulum pigrum]|uniref:hypothetical protein n=1 Tax=Dolosigranulum pigrum TaxID=29394 RepID=UPI000DBFE2CF|nr:hypothetical protein [Dolosigranulum pigrum]QTJ57564.1 hypothetical protein FE335_08880 [Dolosigranulum pigrum]RAN51499.1 hypothetical protein B8A39_06560 [Dolosigranulum pigrum]